MRLPASDLKDYLHQHFSPLNCIVGDEPLQHKEALAYLRMASIKQGFTERKRFDITTTFDGQLESELSSMSLFSEKRCIECRIEGKLNKAASEKLMKLFDKLPVNIVLILIIEYWDQALLKTNWFLKCDEKGLIILSRPLKGGAFLAFCKKRSAELGLEVSAPALNILVERTEGNLLASANTLEKLKLCHLDKDKKITNSEIIDMTHFNARFSVYDLLDCILSGNMPKTIEILKALQEDGIEPLLILWALTKEIRTCIPMVKASQQGKTISQVMQEFYVFKHRIPLLTRFLKDKSLSSLYALLLEAKALDEGIKGVGFQDTWPGLLSLCLKFCGDCHG